MASQILNRIGGALVPIWAGVACIVVASLMAGHWISLPHPKAGSQLFVNNKVGNTATPEHSHFRTFHFLYTDCPCSRKVLNHISQRNPIQDACEKVVLVGENSDLEAALSEQGYRIDVVSPAQLKSKYAIESAPLLVIVDRQNTIQYSGGYTSRKQGLDYQDTEIIKHVIAGKSVAGLPVYGCAVSKGLQAIVDPLKLKY